MVKFPAACCDWKDKTLILGQSHYLRIYNCFDHSAFSFELYLSAGGHKRGRLRSKREERELSDERILGSGDFVANEMNDANEVLDQTAKFDISLDELISRVPLLPV